MREHKTVSGGDELSNCVQLGYVWTRLPLTQVWKRYHARLKDSCIYFCKNIATNEYLHCFVIFNCEVEVMQIPISERDTGKQVKGSLYDIIMVKHNFDKDYLLINFEQTDVSLQQRFKDLTHQSLERSKIIENLNSTNMYSFGKLKIKLIDIKNLVCTSTFFVRISSGPFVVSSRKMISNKLENYSFFINQQIFVPVTNRFGHLKLEIVSSTVKGLFKGREVEQTLFTCIFPVPKLRERKFQKIQELKF